MARPTCACLTTAGGLTPAGRAWSGDDPRDRLTRTRRRRVTQSGARQDGDGEADGLRPTLNSYIIARAMPVLPYRRYEIVSAKNPWEVEAAMRAATEPKRIFRLGAAARPFEGEVGDRVFDVQRAIGYRNSFLPQIRATLTAVAEGSRVTVTMRLHPLVFVFMLIWLIGTVSAFVLLLIANVRKGGSSHAVFLPAIMLISAWTIVAGGFTYEARKAELLLESVMTAGPNTDSVQHRVAVDGAAPRR